MLRVRTKIGPSSIHGTGLFADEFIPKGTITWQYDPEFDPAFGETALDKAPSIVREFLLYYCYFDKKRNQYVLPVDHLRFINHSREIESRNIISTPDSDTALRDIHPDEELLCDYNGFDPDYFKRIHLDSEDIK